MSSRFRLSCIALPTLSALFSIGCVDPNGEFDKFADRVIDAGPPQGGCPAEFFAVNGEFLLGIQTALGPPLRLVATATTVPSGTGGTMTLTFDALIAERCVEGQGGLSAGGEVPALNDVPVALDGTFDVTQAGTTVVGQANPITCSDIVADIQFIGCTKSETLICGDVAGMVMEPITLPLDGSTFGAIQIETGTRGDANLPETVASCPPAN